MPIKKSIRFLMRAQTIRIVIWIVRLLSVQPRHSVRGQGMIGGLMVVLSAQS